MKLFLDDVRDPPSPDWVVARTVDEAKKLITSVPPEEWDTISLDFDLGMTCPLPHETAWQPFSCDHTNGMMLVEWMQFFGIRFEHVKVHSLNPAGRRRLLASQGTIMKDPVRMVTESP